MPAIRVENLSKRYAIGGLRRGHDTVRDRVAAIFRGAAGGGTGARETFWALKDVAFDVPPGEIVGIIGRNGSGKSTLLKILSRITEPTTGRVALEGRVGSLLEVGTGFHPDLTGRENVFLNGSILGMPKALIRRKFDEIVAFSEVERFLETPVKHYSSGMYVRLAFAVAAHLESEILLVDEVLAVGDQAFQKKCLAKMGEVGRQGRTVLFVSHNMQAVSSLTRRCILLSEGRLAYAGDSLGAIREYLRSVENPSMSYSAPPSPEGPRITSVRLETSEPGNVQVNGKPMAIHIEVSTPFPLSGAALALQAFTPLGQAALNLWSYDSERPMCREAGVHRFVCRIPKTRLYMGAYTLTVHFSERHARSHVLKLEGVCPFEVSMYGRSREFGWQPDACAYLEDCEWEVSRYDSGGPPEARRDDGGGHGG
jgi:lipopolysaccharide transport system ATP-binding protein